MSGDERYELDYADEDSREVDAELTVMLADPALKRDGGRLLRVLADLAVRGARARDENVHLSSTSPKLHAVRVGACVAFYAYGEGRRRTTIFLLGFHREGEHLLSVGEAAARLARLRPDGGHG